MQVFTPLSGIVGGSLIGIASSLILLGNGDIMGASGIASEFITSPKKCVNNPSQQWKAVFLSSVLFTAHLWKNLNEGRVFVDPASTMESKFLQFMAGFFVGFGTRLSNGCGTGHGISGLARLSKRSFVAVITFMGTGMLMATSNNFGIRYSSPASHPIGHTTEVIIKALKYVFSFTALSALLFLSRRENIVTATKDRNNVNKHIFAALAGSIFSFGVAISGMAIPSKIHGFLDLSGLTRGTYDPTLFTVLGSGLSFSFLAYQFIDGHAVVESVKKLKSPWIQPQGHFNVPNRKNVDSNLVLGGCAFGIGWSIGGLCPGPALFLAGAGHPFVLYYWWPAYFLGVKLADKVKGHC